MIEPTPRLLTADEAARLFSVSLLRMYELARTGVVPCVRLGRQVRFSRAALDAYIARGGQPLDGDAGWRRASGE